MIKIQLKISEATTQLEQMARQFGVQPINNRLEIPKAIGEGFCQYYALPYRIQLHHYYYCIKGKLQVEGINQAVDGLFMLNINLSNRFLDKNIGSSQYLMSNSGQYGTLFYSPGNNSKGSNEINVPYEIVFFGIPKTALESFLQQSNLTIQDIDSTFCRYLELNETIASSLIKALDTKIAINTFERQGKLMQVLGLILQQFYKNNYSPTTSRLKMKDVELQLKVKEILQNHIFGIAPTIETLSKTLNISKSKLKSDFKALFGQTIYQYYLERKMKIAHNLVSNKEGTIAEIGYRLGYSNISQFSSQFKKQFGISPSQVNQ